MSEPSSMLYYANDPIYAALKTVASYRAELRSIIRGLWNGTFSIYEAFDRFAEAKDRAFDQAWAEGMASVGFAFPDDMSIEEVAALRDAKIIEQQYIFPFLDDTEENSKLNKGLLSPLLARVDRWLVRYDALVNRARQMAASDAKLKWTTHSSETCSSCIRLGGQVRRASLWQKYDLYPNHRRLACVSSAGGVPVCRCDLLPTDEPITRGRFPNV